MTRQRKGRDARPRRWRVARRVVGVASALLLLPSTAAWAETSKVSEMVDGVATLTGSTCPFGDWTPALDTECEDWDVLLYRASTSSQHHNRVPWHLELTRANVLVHPDGSADVLWEVHGDAEVVATFDERHLRFATVRGSVPMSDGTTRVVDLAWDGSSAPLETGGNNGPFNQANDISRHYVDRCFTVNQHAHQTYRANVEATGVIDGTAVEDLPYVARFDPFLARGHFKVVIVRHGSCDTEHAS